MKPDISSVVSFISKVEYFVQICLPQSTLDDSGLILPSWPTSDHTVPLIKITYNDVFYTLSTFNSRKAYAPDGVPSRNKKKKML